MELSTYFNMDYFNQTPEYSQVSSTTLNAVAPQEHLLDYDPIPNENFIFLPTTFDDSYNNFDQTSFLYPHDDQLLYDPILTSFSSDDHYNLLPCSKRQKCFHNNNSSYFFDGFVQNPCYSIMPSEEARVVFTTMQEFKAPQQLSSQGVFGANYNGDHNHETKEKTTTATTTISPQSLAARERRRKITEKTTELGKLVPGGTKMNTAEMLNAAGKYVQYLQAQVEMLQLMNTLQEEEGEISIDVDLQALLVSPSLQEKMYSEEKCFVPKEFVTTLINHDNLRSRTSILKDLKQLIDTDIKKKVKQE